MDDDLEEFRQIFLEECLENAELLERGLMRMDSGESDAETVNDVFRAAHSIKGGGATFGFQPMAELTHFMETLLDEMRSGRRAVSPPDVELLLQGLDVVQAMLKNGSDTEASVDHPDRIAIQSLLQASVETASNEGTIGVNEKPDSEADPIVKAWRILFAPHSSFFLRGNNPLLIIRELKRLGDCHVQQNKSQLPMWQDFDVSQSYLSWDINIETSVSDAELREVFEWIDTDCELSITQLGSALAEELESTVATDATNTVSVCNDGQQFNEQKNVTEKEKTAVAETSSEKSKTAGSIRIATDKIDQLINLVGELVITQSMLSRVCDAKDKVDIDELRDRMADLEHHTRDLQESVMQVRMLPISSAFNRLPRLVRDLSKKLDKDVELVLVGETTELDKTVLERMMDPLVHLVRNAIDHGLESKAERMASGKPTIGQLKIQARQESGSVVIEIMDDGAGIDEIKVLAKAQEKGIVGSEILTSEQINQLIFAPGFSTVETVSDVSGRGVGMDVVRKNIEDLGGRVYVHSKTGGGARVEINLPLSLAILDGQLVRVTGHEYVVPILSIIETLESEKIEFSTIPGMGEVFKFRGEYLRKISVANYFGFPDSGSDGLIVVVEVHGRKIGLDIDEVLGQQQVVVKPLDKNYKDIHGFSGATIMSDGAVALILDLANICEPDVHQVAA